MSPRKSNIEPLQFKPAQRLTYPYGNFIRVDSASEDQSFSLISKAFIRELSETLLSQKSSEYASDFIALGFWFREAAVKQLEADIKNDSRSQMIPAGTVFQVAPGNVETLFLYCGLLSLLLGNSTITRVSNRRNRLLDKLLSLLNGVLSKADYASIAERFQVITCDHHHPVIAELSDHCDLRVLWGSDETIKTLRSIPIKASAKDISFSNRSSLAIISVAELVAAIQSDQARYQRLVEDFCRDGFSLKQQACTSCRMIVWLVDGVAENVKNSAMENFWQAVDAYFERNYPVFSGAEILQRVTSRQAMAAVGGDGELSRSGASHFFERLQVCQVNAYSMQSHTGNGLFLEMCEESMPAFKLPEGVVWQTLGYWGISTQQIAHWMKRAVKDLPMRVVPVGQMNQFERVWDGYDLCREFTRSVAVL